MRVWIPWAPPKNFCGPTPGIPNVQVGHMNLFVSHASTASIQSYVWHIGGKAGSCMRRESSKEAKQKLCQARTQENRHPLAQSCSLHHWFIISLPPGVLFLIVQPLSYTGRWGQQPWLGHFNRKIDVHNENELLRETFVKRNCTPRNCWRMEILSDRLSHAQREFKRS